MTLRPSLYVLNTSCSQAQAPWVWQSVAGAHQNGLGQSAGNRRMASSLGPMGVAGAHHNGPGQLAGNRRTASSPESRLHGDGKLRPSVSFLVSVHFEIKGVYLRPRGIKRWPKGGPRVLFGCSQADFCSLLDVLGRFNRAGCPNRLQTLAMLPS